MSQKEENKVLIFQGSSFKTDLELKLFFLGLFKRICPVGAKPSKKCTNVIADSKPCKQYRDFCIWVCCWSKWNGGVKICHTFSKHWHSGIFHTNVATIEKPSYHLLWLLSVICELIYCLLSSANEYYDIPEGRPLHECRTKTLCSL